MNVLAIVTATFKKKTLVLYPKAYMENVFFFYQEVSFILHPFRFNTSISHFVVVVVFLIVHVPKTNIKSVEQISNVITTI